MKSSSFLFTNNIRMHYLHWGIPDRDRPIVLIHGLSSNARIWEFVAPLLVENQLAPFAPDLRGHGRSDRPEGDYSFETINRDITAFLEMCNLERPILVGHSWGGMIVLDYSTRVIVGPRAPSGIVLVDGGISQLSDIPGATWEKVRELLAPQRLAGTTLKDFLNRLTRSSSFWIPDEAAISTILASYEIDENEIISPILTFERHLQIVRSIWEYKTYEKYSLLKCPVLMIPTRPKEPLTPLDQVRIESKERGVAQAQEVVQRLSVDWMLDTAHDVPLQRAGELAALIAQFAGKVFKANGRSILGISR